MFKHASALMHLHLPVRILQPEQKTWLDKLLNSLQWLNAISQVGYPNTCGRRHICSACRHALHASIPVRACASLHTFRYTVTAQQQTKI